MQFIVISVAKVCAFSCATWSLKNIIIIVRSVGFLTRFVGHHKSHLSYKTLFQKI